MFPKGQKVEGGVLINRHTYTDGIWEGIGVCIGVPAKRGNSEHNGHSQKRAVNCYFHFSVSTPRLEWVTGDAPLQTGREYNTSIRAGSGCYRAAVAYR